MRHRVDHRKLGRTQAHRKAMLGNMVTSLFDKERIKTTDAKAKEARRTAERLITRAKKGYAAYQESQSLESGGNATEAQRMKAVALAHWRQVSRVIRNGAVLKKLFDEIAPKYMERPGGYTRILHLGHRPGDNARTVLLELVGEEAVEAPSEKPTKGKKAEPKDEAATEGKPKRKKKSKSKKKETAQEAKAEAAEEEEAASEEPAEEKPEEETGDDK